MTIRLRYKFFTLLSILTLASMPMGRDHAAAVVTPPATKCNIRIDDPHISKYLLRTRGVLAVKVNARSTCDKAMRNLVLKVEIYKVGLFRDYQVDSAEIRIPGLIYANKVIKNEEANAECLSQKPSKFYGIAFASAVIDGQPRKTLKVTSAKTISLKCGT